ncbi:hypothetical protein F5148DRAFT_1151228 [Russula earlei]|uniref:Uncharacterized protein n=1 Tax=Russula earlei TaxID=71964 RepID=A0ACC0U134_9AGAM|nr:hypothetical protein F5148DRAFT_1151228 [Russula earlei]
MPPPYAYSYDGRPNSENHSLPPRSSSRLTTLTPQRLNHDPPEVLSRRWPSHPDPIVEISVERAAGMTSPSSSEPSPQGTQHSQSSTASSALLSHTPPVPPKDPVNSPSQPQTTSHTKSRGLFRSFPLRLPKVTFNSTAQNAKNAAQKAEEARLRNAEEEAAKEREERETFQIAAQAEARDEVQSRMRFLLSRNDLSEKDCLDVFAECTQACLNGGLDLSAVLQEPLIENKTPVYWAILNRSTSSEADHTAFSVLIVTLLKACGPLDATTTTSVRVACMMTSNNALLQHLFLQFPGLSPLSTGDGGGDVVDVDEKRHGTSGFIAYIHIPRFWLRMSVSEAIKVEFVTYKTGQHLTLWNAERIWTAAFTMSTTREETKWLVLTRVGQYFHPRADVQKMQSRRDWTKGQCVLTGSASRTPSPAQMELSTAKLNINLTQLMLPPAQPAPASSAPPLSRDNPDTPSQTGTRSSGLRSDPPSPVIKKGRRHSKVIEDPNKKTFVSLRKGGNYK